jgi:hypothetical protein
VIGVQVRADDVGDLLAVHPCGAQPGQQLAADEVHVLGQLLQLRPEPGVNEDRPSGGTDQEAADRQPGRTGAVEDVGSWVGHGGGTEVARSGDERPVRQGGHLHLSDSHGATLPSRECTVVRDDEHPFRVRAEGAFASGDQLAMSTKRL